MIFNFKLLLTLSFLLLAWSCTGKKDNISEIVEVDIEQQMTRAYNEGYLELQKGDVLFLSAQE